MADGIPRVRREFARELLTSSVAALTFFGATLVTDARAADPDRRALIVGIDGIRTDALEAARTPHIDALAENGLYFPDMTILPDRYAASDTVSHSSWSSMLSGTWADKHGVRTNDWKYNRFTRYPHFFVRIKAALDNARTVVMSAGPDIASNIPAGEVTHIEYLNAKKSQEAFFLRDKRLTDKAARELASGDPTAMFVYYHEPDWVGHNSRFHVDNENYILAIENIDRHIGRLVEAISERDGHDREDWLIVVCTDHGGLNNTHRMGHIYPEITDVFLVLSGPGVDRGAKVEKPRLVDIAPTVLAHLGVPIIPAWRLDGRVIGLANRRGGS